jgi:endonuclease/exonuclease/phosphatase family metal-dependent hydrolase
MRLATYNVENLFNRPKVMNLAHWQDGRATLNAFATLNALLGERTYTAARKARMVELLVALGLAKSDEGPFVLLRRSRGDLLSRPKSGGITITASGREDWIGSLELVDGMIDHTSIRNTARVIDLLGADVLAVVEAESRPALVEFNRTVIREVGGTPYLHIMLIDGNDERGIDVALMTRRDHPIGNIRSHVDDRDAAGNTIFSRDCPVYSVHPAGGQPVLMLVDHLKSKGFGSTASSNARRRAQAQRIREIHDALRAEGHSRIAIVGDFNDTPDSEPLAPLLKETDLRDVFAHPKFDNGGRPGTYGSCGASNKIDYILLSPDLFDAETIGGVVRQGMWPDVKPAKWEKLPTLTREVEAASDHAAVWVDLDV